MTVPLSQLRLTALYVQTEHVGARLFFVSKMIIINGICTINAVPLRVYVPVEKGTDTVLNVCEKPWSNPECGPQSHEESPID